MPRISHHQLTLGTCPWQRCYCRRCTMYRSLGNLRKRIRVMPVLRKDQRGRRKDVSNILKQPRTLDQPPTPTPGNRFSPLIITIDTLHPSSPTFPPSTLILSSNSNCAQPRSLPSAVVTDLQAWWVEHAIRETATIRIRIVWASDICSIECPFSESYCTRRLSNFLPIRHAMF